MGGSLWGMTLSAHCVRVLLPATASKATGNATRNRGNRQRRNTQTEPHDRTTAVCSKHCCTNVKPQGYFNTLAHNAKASTSHGPKRAHAPPGPACTPTPRVSTGRHPKEAPAHGPPPSTQSALSCTRSRFFHALGGALRRRVKRGKGMKGHERAEKATRDKVRTR